MSSPIGLRALACDLPASIRRWLHIVLGLALFAAFGSDTGLACDLCAIYTAAEIQQSRTGFNIGVAEQFSYFATLRDGKYKVRNEDERLTSSITQILGGYNFTETLGVQINLPIISRTFTRVDGDGLDHGDETGLGDTSIVAMYSPLRWVNGNSVFRATIMAGIKLPTGSAGRLREELAHGDDHDDEAVPHFPNVPGRGLQGLGQVATSNTAASGIISSPHSDGGGGAASGLHGHDLALGSGSVDGVFGAQLFANWKRLYGTGSVQYFVRSQGRFNYQYANELLWRLGPGVFLALDDVGLVRGYTLGLSALLTGETKGLDRLSGVKVVDTGVTNLYLGPALNFTWGESLQATLGGDLPVMQNTSALSLVQDFRIQGALTWRF